MNFNSVAAKARRLIKNQKVRAVSNQLVILDSAEDIGTTLKEKPNALVLILDSTWVSENN